MNLLLHLLLYLCAATISSYGRIFNCKICFSGMISSTTTNFVILHSFLVNQLTCACLKKWQLMAQRAKAKVLIHFWVGQSLNFNSWQDKPSKHQKSWPLMIQPCFPVQSQLSSVNCVSIEKALTSSAMQNQRSQRAGWKSAHVSNFKSVRTFYQELKELRLWCNSREIGWCS